MGDTIPYIVLFRTSSCYINHSWSCAMECMPIPQDRVLRLDNSYLSLSVLLICTRHAHLPYVITHHIIVGGHDVTECTPFYYRWSNILRRTKFSSPPIPKSFHIYFPAIIRISSFTSTPLISIHHLNISSTNITTCSEYYFRNPADCARLIFGHPIRSLFTDLMGVFRRRNN